MLSIKFTLSCLMKYHACYGDTPWWIALGMDFSQPVPSVKLVHCVFELGELWPICKNGLCSECLEKKKVLSGIFHPKFFLNLKMAEH